MDFRKCLVDLSNSDKRIIEAFSALHKDLDNFVVNREDKLTVPTINIIKYIVSCYDKESPVVEEFRKRWTIRKKMAATYAGFFELEKVHTYDVDTILYARNNKINKIILCYLSMLFDREFLMYAVYSELLINVSEQLMRFDFAKPSDTAKAKQNVVELQNDLNELEEKVFSGGDVKQLKITLYGEAQKFMVSELRPENIVSKRERKEKIVNEPPYGDDYIPGPLKFISDN
jgi:hypothetical protein